MNQHQTHLVNTDMSIKTPDYNLESFPEVYEPSEDTFLLLDALEVDMTQLLNLKPKLAVEIGSGSGVIITALSQLLKNACAYFATDINPQACLATKYTSVQNGSHVQCLNMDLLSCFKEKMFDLILFNPPYVLTETDELLGNNLNCSWAGGSKGRVVIDRLLLKLPGLLSENGVLYMVILRENNPEEIVEILQNLNFSSEKILERKIPGEYLYIYKFFRAKINCN